MDQVRCRDMRIVGRIIQASYIFVSIDPLNIKGTETS